MTNTTTTTTHGGYEIRRADERGATRIGWLDSRHSFSFGGYRDPAHMGFRSLRVINDDWIAPGAGFGEHPHRDMEILTWVLEGAVRHADSTGGGGVIRRGDLQAMSAGSGIRHSEFNASETDPVHLLQIWIMPREDGLTPRYDQRRFDAVGRRDAWQLLASPDGRGGSMPIGQDASMLVADVGAGSRVTRAIAPGRFGYLHVATGSVEVDGTALEAGDAVKIEGPAEIVVEGSSDSQVLLFDLG